MSEQQQGDVCVCVASEVHIFRKTTFSQCEGVCRVCCYLLLLHGLCLFSEKLHVEHDNNSVQPADRGGVGRTF